MLGFFVVRGDEVIPEVILTFWLRRLAYMLV